MAVETNDTTPTTDDQRPTEQQQQLERQTREPKTPIRLGMSPTTPEEGWRLAQILAQSELVPKIYRSRPADILVAIQYGIEIGFAPMQALQSIAVINGRASIWGDGFLALLMSSPLYADHDEYYEVEVERVVDELDNGNVVKVKRRVIERLDGAPTIEQLKVDTTAAVCTFWRKGKASPVTRRFSVGQARKAGLLGKEGPWANYPDRMMAMRARSWSGRDTFPDLLRGIRTAEEALDTPPEVDIIETAIVQPRRASEAPGGHRADLERHQGAGTVRPGPAADGHGRREGTADRAGADHRGAGAVPAEGAAAGSDRGTASEATGGADSPRDAPAKLTKVGGLLITGTAYVTPKGSDPHYEIAMRAGDGELVTFVTRDDRLYKEALSFEGTDFRVIATHHDALKAGTPNLVRVLDALALDETAGQPAPHLFD